MRFSMRIVAAVLAVAALAASLLWRRDSARAGAAEAEAARLRASETDLKAKLAQAIESAKRAPEEQWEYETVSPKRTKSPEKPVVIEDTTTRNELVKLLDEKQARLAEARKSLEELEHRLHEAEAKIAAMNQEQQKLADARREFEDRLETANRVSAALEAEVKGRNDRMVRIDSTNRELQKKVEDASKQVTRLAKASGEIEEISRRREVYLNNVLRRYREVTDMYRTLAVRMNSPRETGLPSPGTDLSRIQNAIMLAEEDLRQLQTLNAQAARLHKDMAAAGR